MTNSKTVLVLEDENIFNKICLPIYLQDVNFKFLNDFLPLRTKFKNIIKGVHNFDYIISFHYNDPFLNHIILNANAKGVCTILLIDGPLEYSNLFNNKILKGRSCFRPIIHKVCLTISYDQIYYLKPYNELVFFSTYKNHRLSNNMIDSNIKKEFDFLVTLANTPYFNDEEYSRLMMLLNSVFNHFKSKNYKILLRLKNSWINDLNLHEYENNLTDPVELLLNQVKAVIISPSSIALQAMSMSLPTALLCYRDNPLYYSTGWTLHLGIDISTSLESMISPNSERMLFQKIIYEKNTSNHNITEVILDLDVKKINADAYIDYAKFNELSILNSNWNFNLEFFVIKIKRLIKKLIHYKQR